MRARLRASAKSLLVIAKPKSPRQRCRAKRRGEGTFEVAIPIAVSLGVPCAVSAVRVLLPKGRARICGGKMKVCPDCEGTGVIEQGDEEDDAAIRPSSIGKLSRRGGLRTFCPTLNVRSG